VTFERVELNRIELEVVHEGDPDGDLVVLLHGFPELAHSWRHQIPALVDAGFQVVAPNQRGYGNSDKPNDVSRYTVLELVGDVVTLCEHYRSGDPVIVGHDWGAIVAWHAAVLRPGLFRGVACMSVPFVPRFDVSLLEMIDVARDGGFHYIDYFQEPGVAEVELEADVELFMRSIMWWASGDRPSEQAPGDPATRTRMFEAVDVPDGLPPWLAADDFAVYVDAFRAGGFTAPLNWYRNLHRNWELTSAWPMAHVTIPACFIGGLSDFVVNGGEDGQVGPMVEAMPMFCDDLRSTVLLDGIGHWNQQETPEATNEALLAFLADIS